MPDSSTGASKEARRRRIQRQTQKVAEYIARNPEAKEFYEFWGTPMAELPEWNGPLPAAWRPEQKMG
jgi:hypothetical protein